jgi:hypothetical protein
VPRCRGVNIDSGSTGCPSIYVLIQFARIRTSAFGAEDCPWLLRCLPSCLLSAGPIFAFLPYPWCAGPPALSHRKVTNCDRQIEPLVPAPHLRYRPPTSRQFNAELPQLTALLLSSSLPTPRSSKCLTTCLSASTIALTMTPIVSSMTREWQCSMRMQLFPYCKSNPAELC